MNHPADAVALVGIRSTKLRPDLPRLPDRMRGLPVDKRGYPVPWFVHQKDDGDWDFRVVRRNGVGEAWNRGICWLCGHPLGTYKANVIGPMCGVNRVTSEPPQHLECAEFAIKACPFISRPMAVRTERGLPEERHMPGVPIARNPGVSMIWVTKTIRPFKAHPGYLFRLGPPTAWSFWREGRRATRAEIEEAVRTGLPALEAQADKDGRQARVELELMVRDFNRLLPPEMKHDS
jgi:hypothetical protein